MINWILGGAIIGSTVFVIARLVRRMRNGENCCDGGDCTHCHCQHKSSTEGAYR